MESVTASSAVTIAEAHLGEKNKSARSLVCSRIERERKRDRRLQNSKDFSYGYDSMYRGHEQEALKHLGAQAVCLHGASSSNCDVAASGPVP